MLHRNIRRTSRRSRAGGTMSAHLADRQTGPPTAGGRHRDRTHWLYLAVIAAVVAGIVVGLVAPGVAKDLKPLGTGFVNLIKMMISPVIFCTIVLGIGSVRKAAKVGKVGGLALGYFLVMSTVALVIGLVVGNLLHPGSGLHLTDAARHAGATAAAGAPPSGAVDFLLVIIALGTLTRLVTGLSLFSLLRYLAREFLLIVSTSSSEVALPRLIAKMEHLGVSQPVVGITVPTGYSFNLDGTAIYLTMALLFVAEAMGTPLSVGQQVSLLLFMMIASKGAAGVTGAGLATLAGALQSHRPELVDGVGLIVGIDRFMSEARALTKFAGNAVATVVIGTWTGEFDRDRARRVLAGEDPFDEATGLDEEAAEPVVARYAPAPPSMASESRPERDLTPA